MWIDFAWKPGRCYIDFLKFESFFLTLHEEVHDLHNMFYHSSFFPGHSIPVILTFMFILLMDSIFVEQCIVVF